MNTRLLATTTILASLATAPALAHAAPKPDLSAGLGSAKLTNGVVSGTATVKNSGAFARRSTATLVARNLSTGSRTTLKSFSVPSLFGGERAKVKITSTSVRSKLSSGAFSIQLCADGRSALRERSELNNCVTIGRLTIGGGTPTTPSAPAAMTAPSTPAPSPAPATPAPKPAPAAGGDEFAPPPQHPISPDMADSDGSEVNDDAEAAPGTYAPGAVSHGFAKYSDYWYTVPTSYDTSNNTPERLIVWMHGCGGEAEGDAFTASPDLTGENDRPYILLSLGGADDGCWDDNGKNLGDQEKLVLGAVNDIERHLNINRRQVILAGYSSGGDLGYRTLFDHADWFAGGMFENTAPFSQNGASDDHAAWKFPVDHLAHNQDDTYPYDSQVLPGLQQMINDGFGVTILRKDGGHSDEDGYAANTNPDCIKLPVKAPCAYQYDPDGATVGIDHDLRHVLLPLITKTAAQQTGGAAGWTAPVSAATTAG